MYSNMGCLRKGIVGINRNQESQSTALRNLSQRGIGGRTTTKQSLKKIHHHPLTYSPKWEKYQDMCASAGTNDLEVCHLPSETALQCHFVIFHIICDTFQTDRAGFCVNPEHKDLQVISRIHSETTWVFES